MDAKRQITFRFKDEYGKASKKDKGVILDRMCETLGIGRNTARLCFDVPVHCQGFRCVGLVGSRWRWFGSRGGASFEFG